MNNFLEDFIDGIISRYVGCAGFGDINVDWDGIRKQISSLGENTRQLLEVGILMDKLVEMGFERTHMILTRKDISIGFFRDHIGLEAEKVADELDYSSTTWQQDVLDRVREWEVNEQIN